MCKNNEDNDNLELCGACNNETLRTYESGLRACQYPDCGFTNCSVPVADPDQVHFTSASIFR